MNDLMNSGTSNNLVHFAHLVNLSYVDGEPGPNEKELLDRFALKLGVSEAEYEQILENPMVKGDSNIPTLGKRFDYIYDFFNIIYADNRLDEEEYHLVISYMTAMGFSGTESRNLINRSI